MNAEEIIRNLPGGLIGWYDFRADEEVLFVSGGDEACEVLPEILEERGVRVVRRMADCLVGSSEENCGKYDFCIGAGILERSSDPVGLLQAMRGLLKPSGRLLVGTENRLAFRCFCGDKDVFSGHVLDGIDNYSQVSEPRKKVIKGRAYAKAELVRMLEKAGFAGFRFYSVLPCLTRPQIMIAEGYVPNEPIDVRVFPQYNSPETVFLEEEKLYATLLENNMFHQTAGAFLIECTADGREPDIDQITVQSDRDPAGAMATVLRDRKSVSKRALYSEGSRKVNDLMKHWEYLRRHDVPMVEAHVEDDAFVMPCVNGRIATEYFRNLLRSDRESFVKELEAFKRIIEGSSEHVPYEEVNWRQFEPGWEKRKKDDPNIDKWEKLAFGSEESRRGIGVILKRGYVDMASLNCFHTEQGFLFFDQEFYLDNFPANAIFIRTLDLIYKASPDLERIWRLDELLEYFNLFEHRTTWRNMGNKFLNRLRNDVELGEYNRRHRRDRQTVVSNRYRMDYTQEEYDRLFNNIFRGVDNKKLYLFGSGNYAKKFIEQFGKYYEIAGVLDNNADRWGEELSGIRISSPDLLKEEGEPFKVFICIKYFEEVLAQLKEMGVRDISLYDPRLEYERPLKAVAQQEDGTPKKYHIGYVAGVFDLFHIGHLNLLRRAKEQCDYLIVGVVSDEQVIKSKKTKPYIPFVERMEIVQACRYVDEAVEIPVDRPNTEDAYYMYHFDAQFSGSDYANDPVWHASKVFLQQHGSDMVFFPYTETTSSTELKDQIGGRI